MQSITRSPSVQALKITTLRVRLIHLKNLVYAESGKSVQTMVNVKMQLVKQDGFPAAKGCKSVAHCDGSHGDTEGDGVIEFNQTFALDDLYCMNAELHVRVFESSLIKDQLLGEMFLPLREDLVLSNLPTYVCGVDQEDVGTYVLYGRQNTTSDKMRVGLVQLGLQFH